MAWGAQAAVLAQLNDFQLATTPWSVQFTMSADEYANHWHRV